MGTEADWIIYLSPALDSQDLSMENLYVWLFYLFISDSYFIYI